ncbi:hypothetical protein AT575_08790 [Streptococcus penaeicida]|uniref:YhcH/YjgK/YiaL family protein n=1 Tax=Streptococcus penaeicida TaxID=1765960 RepID=A0A2N8LAB5_9STRE|nr:YhcH/YjgK/YiaL family protein [Streptococcus penaeicida]PND47106.1 hypothetical protein AT575_08790 [Streptococcus penaeicida]
MIFDKLSHITDYKGISENLDIAIDYIVSQDSISLKIGKNIIKDSDVFLNYNETRLTNKEDQSFEYHKDYADIHLLLDGKEHLKFGLFSEEELTPYQIEDDFGLVTCQKFMDIQLEPGYFLIFLPNEYHQPGQAITGFEEIKKQVLKVKMS